MPEITVIEIPPDSFIICDFCKDYKFEGEKVFVGLNSNHEEAQPVICSDCISKYSQDIMMRKGGS